MDRIPCPFVYSNGKACGGHIVRIEAYKADLVWERGKDGQWTFFFSPWSHYHLFCSEKGNHAGSLRQDDRRMKFHWQRLPAQAEALLASTDVDRKTMDAEDA